MIGDYAGRELRKPAWPPLRRSRDAKRRVEIEAEIASLSDDVLRQRLRKYRRAGGGVRVGRADHPGGRRQANDLDDAGATRS